MSPEAHAISIRFATGDDAQDIAEMSRDLIERGLGWSWTPERVRRCLRHPDTNVVVAQRGAESAGFAVMKYGDDEAHLLLLAVRSAHVRQGVGKALVSWLERSAEVAGIGRVTLETRAGNRSAHAFYRQLGYSQVQVLPGYYGGRETCLRLARTLLAPQGQQT